jgi:hypothetical protein
MLLRRIRQRLSNSNAKVATYLLEVLLIILSVLAAIQADRYNQARKDQQKLDEYVQALYQDLQEELETNRMNLIDCQKDLTAIEDAMRQFRYDQNDSLQLGLANLGAVFTRGVFRAFPPTTYDVMLSSGDLALIEDLEFRNLLASVMAFRDNYLKSDLQEFDKQTLELSRYVGQYVDITCLASSEELYPCIFDRQGIVSDAHNELFIYYRVAQLRAFHLSASVRGMDAAVRGMEELYAVGEDE